MDLISVKTGQRMRDTPENRIIFRRELEEVNQARFEAERAAALGIPGLRPVIEQAAESKRQKQSAWENFQSGAAGELSALQQGVQGWAGQEVNPTAQMERAVNQALPGFPALAGRTAAAIPFMVGGGLGGRAIKNAILRGVPSVAGLSAAIPGAQTLAPVARDAALGGLYEGTQHPEAPLLAAGMGALGGAAFPAVAAAGGRALRVQPGPYEQRLLDAGVPLTWGEAAGPGAKQRVERAVTVGPIAGAANYRQRVASGRGWDRYMMQRVAPDPDGITDGGRVGLRQLDDQFNRGYQDITSRTPDVVDATATMTQIRAIADAQRPKMTPESAAKMDATVRALALNYAQGIPKEALKSEKNRMWKTGDKLLSVGDEPELGKAYQAFSDQLKGLHRNVLSPEDAAKLDRLDSLWREHVPIARAHEGMGARRQDYMTPQQLEAAIGATTTAAQKRQLGLGTRPLQDEVYEALGTYQNPIPVMGPGTAEKLTYLGGLGSVAGGLGGLLSGSGSAGLGAGLATAGAGLGLDALAAAGMKYAQRHLIGTAPPTRFPGAWAAPGVTGLEAYTGGGF